MRRALAACLQLLLFLVSGSVVFAQETAQTASTAKEGTPASTGTVQDKNIQEYIELLRTDIRQQKSQIMGAMMQLDINQAAKFWPIYSEYDAELTAVNNLRLANIRDYSRNYDQMTDAKADELVQNALKYRQQRSELLAKYYGRVKVSLGPIQAARFLQIEDQMLMIIDLQLASALPIVEQSR